MKIVGIIPARYQSSRFPGKPLAEINGKSMITRVVEQCNLASKLHSALVATDDERIMDHLRSKGIECVMTHTSHKSGTDRCHEALSHLPSDVGGVINIQGDEPFIKPEQIDQVAQLLEDGAQIATLVKPMTEIEKVLDPNRVKVTLNHENKALYFSRSPIPHIREGNIQKWIEKYHFYKHLGIYGYTKPALRAIAHLEPSPLEEAESLEQLRWLENGWDIQAGITKYESPSVDTPADLERILA
ncbi:MAG: 3-deoxy-manno-octulosonate cytidylyltransferase, partial [Flavobacteriales bacterium]|nr:3-deoxy-manno-octulosonate cytidylyltransferase [Flavobacteriales bacterium]